MKNNDIIGQKFGRLRILEVITKKEDKNRKYYKCKCECGNVVIIRADSLKSGKTQSCGCLQKEKVTKHNLYKSRIYRIWRHLKERCIYKKSKDYKNYGTRGISVCEEWKNSFEKFYIWSMKHGYTDNLTIDRKNVNGNYSPENCRWITFKEQSINKRNNVKILFNGKNLCISEWAELTGINYHTIRNRLKAGKKPEDILHKVS